MRAVRREPRVMTQQQLPHPFRLPSKLPSHIRYGGAVYDASRPRQHVKSPGVSAFPGTVCICKQVGRFESNARERL